MRIFNYQYYYQYTDCMLLLIEIIRDTVSNYDGLNEIGRHVSASRM